MGASDSGLSVLFVTRETARADRFLEGFRDLAGDTPPIECAADLESVEAAAERRWTAVVFDSSLALRENRDFLHAVKLAFAGGPILDLSETRNGVVASGIQAWMTDPLPAVPVHLDRLLLSGAAWLDALDLRTEIERLRRELHGMERLDAETGLWSRARIVERIEEAFTDFRRFEEPFALCVFEMLDLNTLGEEFGPEATERTLTDAGAVVRHALRTTDHAARLDATRFVVAFPGTEADKAMLGARRILESVQGAVLDAGPGRNFAMRLVGGMVGMTARHLNAEDLFQDANRALTRARKRGAGTIEVDRFAESG